MLGLGNQQPWVQRQRCLCACWYTGDADQWRPKKRLSHTPNTHLCLLCSLPLPPLLLSLSISLPPFLPISLPPSLSPLSPLPLSLPSPSPSFSSSVYHLFLAGIPATVSCSQIRRALLGIPGKAIVLSGTANGDGERANCITITVASVMLSSAIP